MKYQFNGKTILIADDDPISALLFKEFIEPTGALTIIAYDGASMLKYIKDQDVDIILLDIRFGNLNGFDLLPKIRRINPSIKVFAQTANALIDDYNKCMEIGFDDYLSKPINSTELFSKLKKHLQL
ncbi:MAG TPA: response regulator [Bacteroidales bacterium]